MKRLDILNTLDKLLDSLKLRNKETEMNMELAKLYIDENGCRDYFLAINDNDVVILTGNDMNYNPILKQAYDYVSATGRTILINVNSLIDNRYYGTFAK